MKSALERRLDAEMDHHLTTSRAAVTPVPRPATALAEQGQPLPPPASRPNRRNGRSRKTVQDNLGPISFATPQDRDATFEPQLVAKQQRRLTGFDDKILALYANGMATRDNQYLVKELYGVDVSPTLVYQITAELDAEVTAWRCCRLEAVWPIVYLDDPVVLVRGGAGRMSPHTMYVAVGVTRQGKKAHLGLWLGRPRRPSSGWGA